MKGFVTAVSIAALLSAVAPSALAQGKRSSHDEVYSDAQAREGAQLYREACQSCHKPDQFVGAYYMDLWTGHLAIELFDAIRDTMPEEAPGTLSRTETAALLAYLFRENGMPAGEKALGSDVASLEEIRIEGPYKEQARLEHD